MRFKDRYLEENEEPFEHHTTKRQIDFTVGIAVGVMIVACSLIYVLGVMFDY